MCPEKSAVERMANGTYGADVASGERPFFLAVGLHKPHVPWYCPARFWDKYPLGDIPPVPHPTMPKDAPAVSVQDWQIRGECNDEDIKGFCRNMSDGKPMSSSYPLDGTSLSKEGPENRPCVIICCAFVCCQSTVCVLCCRRAHHHTTDGFFFRLVLEQLPPTSGRPILRACHGRTPTWARFWMQWRPSRSTTRSLSSGVTT
jgi:hypothetical protein